MGNPGRKLGSTNKPKDKPVQYQDLGEYIPLCQAAPLVGTSPNTFKVWVFSGNSPMGEIKEGYHYYKAGSEYRFCKDWLCELFGILPKVQTGTGSKEKVS